MRRPSALLLFALIAGCFSSKKGDGGPRPDAGPGGGGVPDAGPSGGPHAPQILMLTANTPTLQMGEQLVVTAVVTDPDGIADLLGGSLLDGDSGNAYGAFVSAGAPGSFQMGLDWYAINTVKAIDAPPAGAPRPFLARFFDGEGNHADAQVTVSMQCGQAGYSACAGSCYDLQSDNQHCGSCTSALSGELICIDGQGVCLDSALTKCGDSCVDTSWDDDNCGGCGNSCAAFDSAHGITAGHSHCRDRECNYLKWTYDAVDISCSSLCAQVGLFCTFLSAQDDFECGGGYPGCSNYSTSCYLYVPAQTCDEVVPAAYTPQFDPCGLVTYTREKLTCACGAEGPPPGCPLAPENTVAACTDGCSNDGDVYVDCDDYDCCSVVSCPADSACGMRP